MNKKEMSKHQTADFIAKKAQELVQEASTAVVFDKLKSPEAESLLRAAATKMTMFRGLIASLPQDVQDSMMDEIIQEIKNVAANTLKSF